MIFGIISNVCDKGVESHMEEHIKDVIRDLDFESDSLQKCENNISLTNYEISVLNKYKINYKNCSSLKDVIFLIEQSLEEYDELDDLEEISQTIAERDYYVNTNK